MGWWGCGHHFLDPDTSITFSCSLSYLTMCVSYVLCFQTAIQTQKSLGADGHDQSKRSELESSSADFRSNIAASPFKGEKEITWIFLLPYSLKASV